MSPKRSFVFVAGLAITAIIASVSVGVVPVSGSDSKYLDGVARSLEAQCMALRYTISTTEAVDVKAGRSAEKTLRSRIPFSRRYDVLCIGENLTIKSPIKTNGGDVIIFASSVHISERIDVRPYFERTRINYYLAPGELETPAHRPYISGRDIHDIDPHYSPMIANYYKRCVDCVSGPDGEIWGPELIGGFMPPSRSLDDRNQDRFRNLDGITPNTKDYAMVARRSGNIYIFADKVSLPMREEWPAGAPAPEPLRCDVRKELTPFLLNASGPRGSRGSLGARHFCHDGTVKQCRDYVTWNSPGGDGGDGGSVNVFVGEDSANAASKKRLMEVATADGGAGGGNIRVGLPRESRKKPLYLGTSDPCKLPRASKDHTHLPVQGAPGSISYIPSTTIERLQTFAALVAAKRLRLYEWDELATRAESDSRVNSIDFDTFIEARLGAILSQAQLRVLTDLRSVFQEVGMHDSARVYVAPTFSIKEPTELRKLPLSRVATDTLEVLGRISVAGPSPRRRVEEYLRAIGGIGNLRSTFADDKARAAQVLEALEESNKLFSELKKVLLDLRLDVNKIRVFIERTELKRRFAELSQQMPDQWGTLQSFFKEAKGGADDIRKRLQTLEKEDTKSSHYEFAQLAVFVAMGEYGALWAKFPKVLKDSNPSKEALEEMASILEALRELERVSQEEQREIVASGYSALQNALRSRSNHTEQLTSRVRLFDDLLRLLLISHARDTNRNSATTLTLVTGLERFISGIRDASAFALDIPHVRCPKQARAAASVSINSECVYWRSSNLKRVVVAPLRSERDAALLSTPIYVLAPGSEATEGRPLYFFKDGSVDR
jgi:hypothetical protein